MSVLWGIHNDQPTLHLIEGSFVSVGWEELGDLRDVMPDRETLKARLAAAYPAAKPGAIPVWAGVLHRFIAEMRIGDFVVAPNKADRTLNFGRVTGDFYVDETSADLHPNRRPVQWIRTGVPRAEFTPSALHEIGSALTLFRVKVHADEFLAAIDGRGDQRPSSAAASSDDAAVDLAEEEPNAERVDTYTRDFVVGVLRNMDPYRFERFIAGLLRDMGYRADATQASSDGGIDVIASRDPLGLEPPIIKVQCKRTVGSIGGPDVQRLVGALAHGGNELGLFVTLGGYSTDAVHLERTRQNLRLITGTQLIDLVFEHYEQLDAEWKQLIPLRRVYAIDGAAAPA